MDMESLIREELRYFDSDDQRGAFLARQIAPERVSQGWNYNDEVHDCIVVARDARIQIVWSATGFGPEFPWSVQAIGESDLGMDSEWFAYLYEALIQTGWSGDAPAGFESMGPGERTPRPG